MINHIDSRQYLRRRDSRMINRMTNRMIDPVIDLMIHLMVSDMHMVLGTFLITYFEIIFVFL